MLIDVDWFGDSGFFELGDGIWQLFPDGAGGFIAMPFDPLADLAAGMMSTLIFALSLSGIVMVGPPFVVAAAAALLGLLAYVLVGSLLRPIAGFGLFATCLAYALGTLTWALCDKFETHNPIYLFGYLGIAALTLIAWAGVGYLAEELDGGGSVLAVIVSVGGLVASAILFFTAGGEGRVDYGVYAFRIMHYLALACLVTGVVIRVAASAKGEGSGGAVSLGGLVGCAVAFGLGLVPLVATSLLGSTNATLACLAFLGLHVAIVALAPSLGKDVKASPAWVVMPLFLGSCLYLLADNASGMLIRTDVSELLLGAVLENPLLVALREATASAIAAFAGPVTGLCNGLADFVAGIFDRSCPSFSVATVFVMVAMLVVAVLALSLGATLRSSLAKSAKTA